MSTSNLVRNATLTDEQRQQAARFLADHRGTSWGRGLVAGVLRVQEKAGAVTEKQLRALLTVMEIQK